MAQRHIDHTRFAAQTIFQSLKYYMAKKKSYKLKCHYKPKKDGKMFEVDAHEHDHAHEGGSREKSIDNKAK